jgi:hypothetical protein
VDLGPKGNLVFIQVFEQNRRFLRFLKGSPPWSTGSRRQAPFDRRLAWVSGSINEDGLCGQDRSGPRSNR